MTKKLICSLLTVTLALGVLAGCSSDAEADQRDVAPEQSSSSTTLPSPSVAPATGDAAASSEPASSQRAVIEGYQRRDADHLPTLAEFEATVAASNDCRELVDMMLLFTQWFANDASERRSTGGQTDSSSDRSVVDKFDPYTAQMRAYEVGCSEEQIAALWCRGLATLEVGAPTGTALLVELRKEFCSLTPLADPTTGLSDNPSTTIPMSNEDWKKVHDWDDTFEKADGDFCLLTIAMNIPSLYSDFATAADVAQRLRLFAPEAAQGPLGVMLDSFETLETAGAVTPEQAEAHRVATDTLMDVFEDECIPGR
ncbi:MAG: hypothetical protein KAZ88_05585 [Acidimicrobiia bacterium]|nr:hypothetical protein [Acidimicrobiia bacterium]